LYQDAKTNEQAEADNYKYHPPPEDGELYYIPELYLKNDWELPECSNNDIEDTMTAFESTL